jgi:hypothetical protein
MFFDKSPSIYEIEMWGALDFERKTDSLGTIQITGDADNRAVTALRNDAE